MRVRRVLTWVIVLFETDDALGIGNLDSGRPKRCVHGHGHIALHKGKSRHIFSGKAEHEDKRVLTELL